MAISEATLLELEKKNPDLVAQYRAKMKPMDESVADAQKAQDYGTMANIAGKAITDFGNSKNSDVVLHNRFQEMGGAPTVKAARNQEYDGSAVDAATSRNLARAKDDKANASSDFDTDQKLKDRTQSLADASKARDKEARSNNPKSAESAAAREYLKQVAPNAASIANFDNMTEAQVQKVAPQLFERYKLDESISARKAEAEQRSADRKEEALQRSADRAAMMSGRREDKVDEREWKEEQVVKANVEKKKTLLNEVEDRRTIIHQNLDILDKMVKENGTFEAFGSHNQDMDRLVDAIATDMAKLQDPTSVARPSEVDTVKKNLIQSGFKNNNGTARDIIKNFRAEVENRANSAYTIRGIEKPGQPARMNPPPNGQTVTQDGKTYKWDGNKYVEQVK